MSEALLVPIAFVLGSALGSFLNVCIVRLPADQSIVRPRSRCPTCGHAIPWWDNIPLVSWVILRGRCRVCQASISIRYPLVELAVALLWAGSAWFWGPSMMGLAAAVFGTLLLGIAVTDAQHYLIPDEFTLGGLVLGLVLALLGGYRGLLDALIGAAVGFALLWIVAVVGTWIFKEEAMGGGDIKMMAMVGAFVGWKGVLLTIFLGALAGSIVFVPLTLKKKRLVPFGVFLAVGAAVTFLVGDAIISWYVHFIQIG